VTRRRITFWALVAVQALIPLGLIAWNEVALATGTEVTLRTVPVDPLDLFRGRYVRLSYEISRVPVEPGVGPGDTVYVALRPGDGRSIGDLATEAGDGLNVRVVLDDDGRARISGLETVR
jgi:uncharacterized membrane-anchored protein